MPIADPGSTPAADDGPAGATLCATAAVALRWWPSGPDDREQAAAECAAGLKALEACLESDGSKPVGAQGRLEAKIDLLLVALDRLGGSLAAQSGRGGRARFLHCDARFGPDSIEWDEPMPAPPDGTPVVLEVRAAAGHPVSTLLHATLARAPAGTDAGSGTRLVARLVAMAPPLRDAYERCVFILHRQSVRRAHAGTGSD